MSQNAIFAIITSDIQEQIMRLSDLETATCAWWGCEAIYYETSKWRPAPWFEVGVHETHDFAHLINLDGDGILCGKHMQTYKDRRESMAKSRRSYRPPKPRRPRRGIKAGQQQMLDDDAW